MIQENTVFSLFKKKKQKEKSIRDYVVEDFPQFNQMEQQFCHLLIQEISEDKKGVAQNNLVEALVVLFVFNHERIEGNSLSLAEVQALYATKTTTNFFTEQQLLNESNDLQDSYHHIEMFDFLIDTLTEDLSEDIICNLHKKLFGKNLIAGKYKTLPNAVGNVQTAPPQYVHDYMNDLLKEYQVSEKNLLDILRFHVRFERIHPFADGNGRVGRAIMFRECLREGIIPFIVTAESKFNYYHALQTFNRSNECDFINYVFQLQKTFVQEFMPYLHDANLQTNLYQSMNIVFDEKMLVNDFDIKPHTSPTTSNICS